MPTRACSNCAGTGQIKCTRCGGWGKSGAFGEPCPLCRGRGLMSCPTCGGRGSVTTFATSGISDGVDVRFRCESGGEKGTF